MYNNNKVIPAGIDGFYRLQNNHLFIEFFFLAL